MGERKNVTEIGFNMCFATTHSFECQNHFGHIHVFQKLYWPFENVRITSKYNVWLKFELDSILLKVLSTEITSSLLIWVFVENWIENFQEYWGLKN